MSNENNKMITSNLKMPTDGLKGLAENWKSEIISGFLVSLVALPLCLGIAMASGFPAFGGLITAIIGGLIVGPICGSRLTIKGPAAGLIAIAIGCVEALGQGDMLAGYKLTLAVIVVASLFQILFALFKLGRFGDFFPLAAVHGMLAAIGFIIISKQIHPLLGVKPIAKEPLELFLEVPNSIMNANPEIALIGITSLIILIFTPIFFAKLTKLIPAPLIAVIVSIVIGQYFDLEHEHFYSLINHQYSLSDKFLVNLPANFLSGVTMPDFSQVFSLTSIQYIVMFALIGSLESLLTVKAVDGLDPYKRKSDMNKDLLAVGIGNCVCGFLGGLPMISEVVRSYTNVSNGAKTRWSNFFHGLSMLLFVLLLATTIHKIPTASLSAILCFVGFRLASPKHFIESKEIGIEQLLIFTTTIVVTLMTDLLIGVGAGIVVKFISCLYFGAPVASMFKSKFIIETSNNDSYQIKVTLPKVCYFGNIVNFIAEMKNVEGKSLMLDFKNTILVDHTFMKQILSLESDYKEKGLRIIIEGLERLNSIGHDKSSLRRLKASI